MPSLTHSHDSASLSLMILHLSIMHLFQGIQPKDPSLEKMSVVWIDIKLTLLAWELSSQKGFIPETDKH